MKTLYIDATVRENSRTAVLASHLLERLGGDVTQLRLEEISMPVTDSAYLAKRNQACAARDFSDPMFDLAKAFAAAEQIVIAAPFWDLSFPASLKQFFEHINVIGLTFAYNEAGNPYGLCNAKRLYYVTTAGGQIFSEAYGFGYVQALANRFYGIGECVMCKAEGLDIADADVEQILADAKQTIDQMFA